MKRCIIYSLAGILLILNSCKTNSNSTPGLCEDKLNFACEQTELLSKVSLEANRIPRTLNEDGHMHWTNKKFDWTEGFFPGTCWYLYEYTNDQKWKDYADQFQNMYVDHRLLTTNHDLGFIFNCSYGNAYRLTKEKAYKDVLVDAATSLITRFNPNVGCIKSWDVDGGWQAKRGWEFPVIIDNMMNLELLFTVSELTGDSKFKEVAIAHANTTLKNHFREDNSSYHVIDYDPETGEVRNRNTAQGYAHESAWSRGQAWGLYGYTVCYRFTKDERYLKQAEKIAKFIFNDENLPEDHVPYWDFDAPKIPNEPRDASAAAIIASALIELDGYSANEYLNEAKFILKNLSSELYLAKLGENKKFILKHSVGSIPHGNEIDVPLNYADYYYVEALMRLKNAKK